MDSSLYAEDASFTEHPHFISLSKEIIMANPIWKDYYVNLGTADSIEYQILCDESLVYAGRAWKRPGQTDNIIRINDICADYLTNALPPLVNYAFASVGKSFSIVGGGKKTDVSFLPDWSYEDGKEGSSAPINRKVSPRQFLLYSTGEAKDAVLVVANGTSTTGITAGSAGVGVLDLRMFANLNYIVVDGLRYDVTSGCERYCLYYVNAHGGWDSLLIEGNYSEVDNVARHTREMEYDNRDVKNRGAQNFVNEISKSLTLHTSWMSDDESSRMHHLLNSNEVYLYDIEKEQMIPVLLTNSTTEYKTYKGNGGKLVNYAIEVQFANGRVRR